jgi:hypothetical protein
VSFFLVGFLLSEPAGIKAWRLIRPLTTSTTLTRVIATDRVCGVTETVAMSVAATTNTQILDPRSTMRCLDFE